MTGKKPYMQTGLGLLVIGGMMALPSYFIFRITWLTALSICVLILAFILIALARAVPRLPPRGLRPPARNRH